jgi:hypothetical protein
MPNLYHVYSPSANLFSSTQQAGWYSTGFFYNARIGRDTLQNRAEVPNFPLGRHFLPANVVSALFSLPARFRAVISGTNLRH